MIAWCKRIDRCWAGRRSSTARTRSNAWSSRRLTMRSAGRPVFRDSAAKATAACACTCAALKLIHQFFSSSSRARSASLWPVRAGPFAPAPGPGRPERLHLSVRGEEPGRSHGTQRDTHRGARTTSRGGEEREIRDATKAIRCSPRSLRSCRRGCPSPIRAARAAQPWV